MDGEPDLEDINQLYDLDNYIPKAGYVPDDSTAVNIALAVWKPIYGDGIYENQPFNVSIYKDSLWLDYGTLPDKYSVGGVPYAFIDRKTGKVIKVIHTE